jgi:hypothetical protein
MVPALLALPANINGGGCQSRDRRLRVGSREPTLINSAGLAVGKSRLRPTLPKIKLDLPNQATILADSTQAAKAKLPISLTGTVFC